MKRLLCITTLTILLNACQSFEPAPDNSEELTHLLDFQQALENRDAADLNIEAEQLRELLQQSTDAPVAMRLQLTILESRIQLQELQQVHEAQLQQIKALNTQIEALTAIEQQINRRGQQQEINNE